MAITLVDDMLAPLKLLQNEINNEIIWDVVDGRETY